MRDEEKIFDDIKFKCDGEFWQTIIEKVEEKKEKEESVINKIINFLKRLLGLKE